MKTKALIGCAVTVTAQLICVFVFACAKSCFSHDAAHLVYSTYFPFFTGSMTSDGPLAFLIIPFLLFGANSWNSSESLRLSFSISDYSSQYFNIKNVDTNIENLQLNVRNNEVLLHSSFNEKRGNKQCLLDTPRRVTVNNKRLISKCKKSEKKYAYLQKPWHYEELQREKHLPPALRFLL